MKIVIPARLGSKGLPLKNRKLFTLTADTIPPSLAKDVYVTTDDPFIEELAKEYNFNTIVRPNYLANDTASMYSVLTHAVLEWYEEGDEDIIVLYLTYPERTWKNVEDAYEFFLHKDADSLLCRKEIKTSPYLMIRDIGDNHGEQITPHDLYRRQDYPKCYEISHFICIFKLCTLHILNNNLYYDDTVFMDIPSDIIDVDTEKDLDKFNENIRNK
jgi:CMP-N-acetylneuraminic acid synthetase